MWTTGRLFATVMDILRAVASPNLDIRRKTLDIVLDLITVRNIDEVVSMLKKEITKSQTDTAGWCKLAGTRLTHGSYDASKGRAVSSTWLKC